MKYLLSGGGTGGHITPILAVAEELKLLQPDCTVIYVGERNSKFQTLTNSNDLIDEKHSIFSGKFRRYHEEKFLKRILDMKTNFKNLRDILFVIIGYFQSISILMKSKPDVVFLKGGYVGVPIGFAAALLRIPIVTHDSDAIPGLANKVISKWTKIHATALSSKYYNYPKNKVKNVGVLVEKSYQPVNVGMKRNYKKQLDLPEDDPLLLVTGGSSGAERLNVAVVKIINKLLESQTSLRVIHQVGQGKESVYAGYRHERLRIVEFMKPMYEYTGAADLIVSRAGANALAEFGTQGKACIIVPNPDLTGGHQTKNAQILEEQGAAIVVTEDKITDDKLGLLASIEFLLGDETKRQQLAEKLQKTILPNAANELAKILVNLSINMSTK